jgi:hypothetical protein
MTYLRIMGYGQKALYRHDPHQEVLDLLTGVSPTLSSSDLTWSTQVSNQSSPLNSIMISRCLDVVRNGQSNCLVVRESSCFLIELVVLDEGYEYLRCHLQSLNHGRTVFFAKVISPLISMVR